MDSNIKKENNDPDLKDDASLNASFKKVDLTHKLKIMTYEETFNSLMSVGLGALVGGLYMARIIYLEDESILTNYLGLSGVLGSIIIFSLAFLYYKKNMDKVKEKYVERSASFTLIILITLILIIGAILSLILIMGS